MKKIISFLLLFICFLTVSKAEEKPKLAISVFANETTCWTCLKSVNTFSKAQLINFQSEITIYFCSDNSDLLPKLLNQYELNCKSILDPECLYAKKYNISRVPAIVIKDVERDSIILCENWENPQEYLNLMIRNEKLLLLADTNFNPVKYFGKVDPICETTTLAGHFMSFPVTPATDDNNIYYLMSFSNKLFVFDLDGNYLKTIELQFAKDYNPPLENIPEKITMDEHYKIWDKYKMLSNVFIRKDKIIVVGGSVKIDPKTLKQGNVYYVTVFDKTGKRISNTFQLPKGIHSARQMVDDRLLFVDESAGDGTKGICWFDVNKIINK